MTIRNVLDYGATPYTGVLSTLGLRAAASACRERDTLLPPPGT